VPTGATWGYTTIPVHEYQRSFPCDGQTSVSVFCSVNGPVQTFAQGTECVSDEARRWIRGGLGHPEGYFEAFANLYSELADVIGAKGTGRDPLGFPDALDGAKGLAFVEAFLRSYHSSGTWATVDTV
jgi:hypothetical protein